MKLLVYLVYYCSTELVSPTCKQRAEYLQKQDDILIQENKAKARARYKAEKKASVRDSYKADPKKKKASVRDSYKVDPSLVPRPTSQLRMDYITATRIVATIRVAVM